MDNLYFLMFIFFVGFIVLTEIFRRYKTFALIFFLFSLPALFLPNSNGLFMQIKTMSVLIPICLLLYARLVPAHSRPVFSLIYIVIVLNIVEASIIDITTGNHLNLVAALALIILLPFSTRNWKIAGARDDFSVHLPACWPFLYTSWNLCFLYSARITTFGYAIPLLLAPLFYVVFIRRGEWYFQARAYSFAGYLVFRAVFSEASVLNLESFDLTQWYSRSIALTWGAINVVFASVYLYQPISKHVYGKLNKQRRV